MKSNYWALCFVALLCIESVKSWTYFPANIDILNETGDGEISENGIKELNEGDLAKQLDESKRLLKDLDSKISRFYGTIQREGEKEEEEEEEEDKCEGYCKNEGTCSLDKDGKAICACKPRYEGPTCETDKCEGYCKNEGTCSLDNDGKAICACKPRYEGPTCETDKCVGYCKNDGTCSVGDDEKLKCTCKPRYEGPTCETDKCVGYCKNDGTCSVGDDEKLKCTCKPGYEGPTCETGKCVGYCKNDGTCSLGDDGNQKCTCKPGYEGPTCETDKCANLCLNGGSCKVDANTGDASCNCPARYTGSKCETDKCKDFCQNGGTCNVDNSGKVTCTCSAKYTGTKCETEITAYNCKEKCGESADVVCKGVKTEIDKITCSCNNKKLFHDKDCKEDLCLEKCDLKNGTANANLKCTGDGVDTAECECVTPETMSFDETVKKCKTDYCRTVCGEVQCEEKFKKKTSKDCKCEDGEAFDTEDKTCKADYCFEKCGAGYNTSETGVVCKGDKFNEEKATCSCQDTKKIFYDKQCRKQCSTEKKDCKNYAPCKEYGDSNEFKFCDCHEGTVGDTCEEITACKTGDLTECTGTRGKCIFDEDTKEAMCNCTTKGTKFYDEVKYCEVECKEDQQCRNGKTCKKDDGFCACKEGMGGDSCKEVLECKKELGKTCTSADAKCVYDETSPNKASCQCNKKNFTYNAEKKKCEDPFCVTSPCQDGSTCSYNIDTGTGLCLCATAKYYNYHTNKCEDPDNELKCLLKKTPCGKNEVCKNGVCECAENYKKKEEGKSCEANFCESDHCFTDGECNKKDGSCTCGDLKYYDGEECQDAKCVWKNFKKNCTCPEGLTGDTGKCKPENDKAKLCSKDCGHGYCVEEGDGDDKTTECKCMPFAELHDDTCILDVTVCATKKLTKDSKKCDCSGPLYKQAKDDITCELVTCADKSAQKDCADRGGQCQMRWKNDDGKIPGYYCECPKGYVMDNEKRICTDACSLPKKITECAEKDQFCYNSLLDGEGKPESSCQCPPPLKKTSDGKCTEIGLYVYLLKDIPVLKKKYEQNNVINTVLLNADIILSLEQTYENLAYGYLFDYKVDGNVLMCSAWMNFKKDPKADFELERVKTAAVQFPNTICEGCDPDALVWPPYLMLSGNLTEVSVGDLKFCTDEVKNSLCGKHAVCDEENKKCSCPKGFRTAAFSIRDKGTYRIQSCEDIDECAEGSDACSGNTTCVNVPGDYRCDCKAGYKKKNNVTDPNTDKGACSGLCFPNPCKKGKCTQKDNMFNCECEPGAGGSLCDRQDPNFAKAKQTVVAVGAILGVLLGLVLIAFFLYYRKNRRNSGSQDFMPATRHNAAEMTERRHMRGVTNKSYE